MYGELTRGRTGLEWMRAVPVVLARPAVSQARTALKLHEDAAKTRTGCEGTTATRRGGNAPAKPDPDAGMKNGQYETYTQRTDITNGRTVGRRPGICGARRSNVDPTLTKTGSTPTAQKAPTGTLCGAPERCRREPPC